MKLIKAALLHRGASGHIHLAPLVEFGVRTAYSGLAEGSAFILNAFLQYFLSNIVFSRLPIRGAYRCPVVSMGGFVLAPTDTTGRRSAMSSSVPLGKNSSVLVATSIHYL